jgi:hypothetical protein
MGWARAWEKPEEILEYCSGDLKKVFFMLLN